MIPFGKIPNEFVLAQNFIGKEGRHIVEKTLYLLLVEVVELADEIEVLLRTQEADEEVFVEEGSDTALPIVTTRYGDAVDGDATAIRFDQIEDETEEGSLAGTVIAYQTEGFAVAYGEMGNIQYGNPIVFFAEIGYLYHIYCGRLKNVVKIICVRGSFLPKRVSDERKRVCRSSGGACASSGRSGRSDRW